MSEGFQPPPFALLRVASFRMRIVVKNEAIVLKSLIRVKEMFFLWVALDKNNIYIFIQLLMVR